MPDKNGEEHEPMKLFVGFQYKPQGRTRPYEEMPDENVLEAPDGEYMALPNIGDTVGLSYADEMKVFKVVSRHFYYQRGICTVNVVVTDASQNEVDAAYSA